LKQEEFTEDLRYWETKFQEKYHPNLQLMDVLRNVGSGLDDWLMIDESIYMKARDVFNFEEQNPNAEFWWDRIVE